MVGFLSALVWIPIAESLGELVLAHIEAAKVKVSLKINQYTKNIQEIQAEMQPTATHTIGFDISQDGDCFDEEDPEDDE